MIATALIELMLPVSLKMASADGELNERELAAIHDFYVEEWGYSTVFVTRMMDEYQNQLEGVSYARLAESLGTYCADSKDCDKESIMTGLVTHRNIDDADRQDTLCLVLAPENRAAFDFDVECHLDHGFIVVGLHIVPESGFFHVALLAGLAAAVGNIGEQVAAIEGGALGWVVEF